MGPALALLGGAAVASVLARPAHVVTVAGPDEVPPERRKSRNRGSYGRPAAPPARVRVRCGPDRLVPPDSRTATVTETRVLVIRKRDDRAGDTVGGHGRSAEPVAPVVRGVVRRLAGVVERWLMARLTVMRYKGRHRRAAAGTD
jgi:hypothetical protein